MDESPRWLIQAGKVEEAKKVLINASEYNVKTQDIKLKAEEISSSLVKSVNHFKSK